MKMTIECSTTNFARILCNTLSFFAMSGVKDFSVGDAVRALAGAEEVYNYAS